MKTVQPIRNKDDVQNFKDYFNSYKVKTIYVLFCTGIYLPIRIKDILNLRVRDVRNRDSIRITEGKTKKGQNLKINVKLKKIFQEYCVNKRDYEFLFMSRQKKKDGRYAPMTRQNLTYHLKKAERQFGLQDINCHSMRKTFGWHHYQRHKDIETLRQILNHGTTEETAIYIGINQFIVDKSVVDIDY